MRVNFMAKDHLIPITNGVGSKELLRGSYDVSANVSGYDNSSINPKILNVLNNENRAIKVYWNGFNLFNGRNWSAF